MVRRITATGVSATVPMWNVAPALLTTPVSGPAAANISSTSSGASRSVRTSVQRRAGRLDVRLGQLGGRIVVGVPEHQVAARRAASRGATPAPRSPGCRR